MFVRGILEGENATCVTYEVRPKGVFAIIPDLEYRLESVRGEQRRKEHETEIFRFWLPLYMYLSSVATLRIELSSCVRVCTREGVMA